MLALAAAVCFLLALFNVALGALDLVTLGLLLLALHLALDLGPARLAGLGGRRPLRRRR